MNRPIENAADAMNEALQDAETAIYEQKFNVPAKVALNNTTHWLAYGKLDGEWQLHVINMASGAPTDLMKAQMFTRLQACRAIPDLVKALRVARDDTTAEIVTATETLRAYIETLKTDGT